MLLEKRNMLLENRTPPWAHLKVCSKHFDDQFFLPGKKRLLPSAVPSICVPFPDIFVHQNKKKVDVCQENLSPNYGGYDNSTILIKNTDNSTISKEYVVGESLNLNVCTAVVGNDTNPQASLENVEYMEGIEYNAELTNQKNAGDDASLRTFHTSLENVEYMEDVEHDEELTNQKDVEHGEDLTNQNDVKHGEDLTNQNDVKHGEELTNQKDLRTLAGSVENTVYIEDIENDVCVKKSFGNIVYIDDQDNEYLDNGMIVDILDEARDLFRHDKGVQTCKKLSAGTPRKKALKRKLHNARRIKNRFVKRRKSGKVLSATSKEAFTKLCEKFLSPDLKLFVLGQMGLSNKKKCQYTNEYKQFALSLYFSSPRAYKLLSRTFRLPSKRTLERITEKWPHCSGLNDFVFEAIKLKADNFNEREKECVLAIDEMSVKSFLSFDKKIDKIIGFNELGSHKRRSVPAKNVLVLMLRGIMSKWKQPLSYFFVGTSCAVNSVHSIVGQALLRLTDTKLNVGGVVSDLGSNFTAWAKYLGINRNNSVFAIDGKEYFYIFDAPHIIKAIRNHFMCKRFQWGSLHTDFEYVKQIYNHFKNANLKLSFKLTKIHMFPNSFQKMKVKYATQLLSTTAATLGSFIVSGSMPTRAIGTMEFVEKFDGIFDFLNSSSKFAGKERKAAYAGSSEQREFVKETIEYLKSLRVLAPDKDTGVFHDVTNTLKCIESLIVTLNSVTQLFDKLKEKGYKYLLTRNLQQDCLEHFFASIRSQGGWCRNPPPIQFCRAFKKLFASKFLNFSTLSNCELEDDFFTLLQNQDHLPLTSALEGDSYENCVIVNEKAHFSCTPNKNALNYFCGYLLHKCLKKHECDICNEMKIVECNENSVFIELQRWDASKDSLYSTCKSFTNYVEQMDVIFVKYFNLYSNKRNISHAMFQQISKIPFVPKCENFPIEYLKKLFVTARIHFALRFYNNIIKEQKTSKVRKNDPKLLTLSNL